MHIWQTARRSIGICLPVWIFTGLFLGLINFLAAWCWMKGHFFGGFIANLCSPIPLALFVTYMELFDPTI